MFTVYYIEWMKSDNGWGQHPNGVCLYSTKEMLNKHIKEYSAFGSPEYYNYIFDQGVKEVSQEIYNKVQLEGKYWESLH